MLAIPSSMRLYFDVLLSCCIIREVKIDKEMVMFSLTRLDSKPSHPASVTAWSISLYIGIIRLVRAQNLPIGVRNVSFLGIFAYVLNE